MLQQGLSLSTIAKVEELQEKYPTIAAFGATFNPSKIDRFSQFPTRCLFGTAPTLIELNITYTDTAAIQWLIAQLSVFQEQVNVPNKMTVYQIESCAQTISERFGYLKTTEIMLFLSRLKGGLYNVDWYNYITPDKVVAALSEHFIPYRNNLYYKRTKQEEEKRKAEEAKTPGITWEEYCKLKGIDRPNPLLHGNDKQNE